MCVCEICSVVSNSLWPHGLYNPWNSLGQNIGVGSLSLLQGIFQTQGWNPGLPHCRQILYQLSHKNSEIGDEIGTVTISILQMRKLRHRAQKNLSKVTQPVTEWQSCESNPGHLWASSRSWWWTGKTGVLQSMGSQRAGHDWATELNWTEVPGSSS